MKARLNSDERHIQHYVYTQLCTYIMTFLYMLSTKKFLSDASQMDALLFETGCSIREIGRFEMIGPQGMLAGRRDDQAFSRLRTALNCGLPQPIRIIECCPDQLGVMGLKAVGFLNLIPISLFPDLYQTFRIGHPVRPRLSVSAPRSKVV